MRTKRTLSIVSATALMFMSTACGNGGDDATTTSDVADPPAATIDDETETETETETEEAEEAVDDETETGETDKTETDEPEEPEEADEPETDEPDGPETGEADEADEADETETDEVTATSCPEIDDETRAIIDGAAPEAPAPGGLVDAVPPTDIDGVIALFDTLPDELIGGTKAISARSPDHLDAVYQSPDRASQYGFQAMDLRTSFMGSILPEPRADMFVAFWVLSDDDDFVADAAGHEGDLYWVTFVTTNSGYGIEDIEEVYSVAWGEACGPWAFMAGAPTETGRDELIAAFSTAAEQVASAPDPSPASPDEQAAEAALLTLDDLGAEWLSFPNLPTDEQAFNEFVTGAMADEPSCAAALENEDVRLGGLLDVVAATSIARAESPRFVSGPEGREIEHTVLVFESTDRLSEVLQSASELGWVDCVFAIYDDLAQAQYGAAFPGASASVDSATERLLDVGDDAVALRFELTLEAPGGSTIGVTQDISIVPVGRAASSVYQETLGGEVDEGQTEEIIALAAARVAQQFEGS